MRSLFSPESDSTDAGESLKKALLQRGIAFSDKELDQGTRAIEVDYGPNVGLAQLVTILVFDEVFKARLETDCIAFVEKVLVRSIPRATGVDS